jgi:ketosteroid isomerase-like protein
MQRKKVIDRYLACLERGDTDALIRLFSTDGIVISPLFGRLPATAFYQRLAAETTRSELTPRGVYLHAEDPNAAAAAFHYQWTRHDGCQVGFECVDLFRFNQAHQITQLTIIYDTNAVRPSLAT